MTFLLFFVYYILKSNDQIVIFLIGKFFSLHKTDRSWQRLYDNYRVME